MTDGPGTPFFMSPEALTCEDARTNKVDVYAFGTFLCAIFSNNLQFADGQVCSLEQLIQHIRIGDRFGRPEGMPDALWNLARECWLQEPDQRPTFAEITRRMMRSDDFAISETDLADYHEYRTRIMRESADRSGADSGAAAAFGN
jgi:serine/threonine protein kinase